MEDKHLTILVTVPSIIERDKLIKRIYTNLTTEPDVTFTIVQDQVNRIKVFHNVAPDIRVLIRTYLVLVLPVLVDLSPLNSIFGTVDFHLEETIKQLTVLTKKLQSMQGRRVVRGSVDADNFRRLVDSLSG